MRSYSPRGLSRLNLWVVACFAAIALMLGAMATTPVQAQSVLDYSTLLGSDDKEKDEAKISRPASPGIPGASPGTPDLSDYARVVGPGGGASTEQMMTEARKAIGLFRARLSAMVKRLPDSWREIETALSIASPTGRPSYFIGIALFAGLLLIVGKPPAFLFYIYAARPLMIGWQRGSAPEGYLGKLPVLASRLSFTIIGVAIGLTSSVAIGLLFYQEHEATLITVVIVFAGFSLYSTVDTLWRMALAPFLPAYRLPAIEDDEARSLYLWLSGISGFGIAAMALTYWMHLLGLPTEIHTALTVILSFATVVLLLAMLRTHRGTVGRMIYGGRSREEASWVSVAVASIWGPLVTLYLFFTWGDLSFRMIMGIETAPVRLAVPYLIFMAGLVVYALAMYLIERTFNRTRTVQRINAEADAARRRDEAAETVALRDVIAGDSDGSDLDGGDDAGGSSPRPAQDPDLEALTQPHRRRASMQTMEDLARRTASLFAIGAVAYAMIRFWGGNDVFETVPILGLVQDVIDIVLIGYIIFHAVRIWIDQKIAEEDPSGDDDSIMEGEGGGTGASRLATLLPLFRNFLLIVIAVTVLLLIAIEIGVNVAPLFAGAGIVGLAIGFGAQTLVRDILSGAFFLMDDAFRKGEYIDVGEVKGTVEKISLRSFQLRHHLGKLHTIPFGEIKHLTNFSRDWVMMKLPLRLTYDTDVEQVRKLIKKLGQRLLEDPEIGQKFIQPLKSQGVIQMDDSAMIVRMKFMTHPGEQWVLRKRIYAEIRVLFAQEGIKFAHREVTVRIPDLDKRDEALSPDEQRAIGAAARRAADQADEDRLMAGGMGEAR